MYALSLDGELFTINYPNLIIDEYQYKNGRDINKYLDKIFNNNEIIGLREYKKLIE